MNFKDWENPMYKRLQAEVQCEGDERVYRLENETGSGEIRTVVLAPGIELAYNCLHMRSCCRELEGVSGCLSINYCSKGCYEYVLKSGFRGLMGEGDMAVNDHQRRNLANTGMPLGYFEGVTVALQLDEAQKSLETLSPFMNLNLRGVFGRLCAGSEPFLMRTLPEAEHIFQELCRVDERIRRPYMLLKVLELLLMMSILEDEQELPHFSQEVVEQTKNVYAWLMENPLQQRTAKQLCRQFHISNTNLRSCFRAIYGQPLATFARGERLKKAASMMLDNPHLSIGKIAEQVGYQNQSKFTAAFKSYFQMTPMQYRRQCSAPND